MNQLGVKKFKETVLVGDELSVNTREFSYFGRVTAINDNSFEIKEGNLKFDIYYSHVWAYAKH